MANENKEIGDIVKKCKILLLDIEGTTTSISFVKDKLFPYAEENVKQFLETQWESDDVKEVVMALRKLALEDKENSVEGHVAIPGEDATKEDQIEGLVNNVKWQMSSDRKAGPLKTLQGMIWKQGYDKGDIKGHVYDDVSSALEQWKSVNGQKIYIYSSGSVQAQKLLFGQSLAGDLLQYIEGHFDTAVGAKQESASYSAIVEKIGSKAEDVLFLTDIVKEAEAARTAGLHAVLVSREGNAPLSSEATDSFTVIHSLGQLTSNKRKTDPQEEQPAKVPKTDISNDVKTTAETEKATLETTEKTNTELEGKQNEPEKMEVEEEPTPVKQTTDEPKLTEENKLVEQIPQVAIDIKDVKDSDIPIVDEKPTEQKGTKAETQKTEIMETETSGKDEKKKVDVVEKKAEIEKCEPEKPQSEKSEPKKAEVSNKKTEPSPNVPNEKVVITEVKEQTPIVEEMIITEIEEITDKENLSEMADIIEDLEPVVEEPNGSEDMELQNVGDVLEKECDEILSKVQDVTNLDNIPLKSTLNPIAEETMETDNMDSNDIMERILDQETERETQQAENAPKIVADVVDESKTEKVIEKTEKVVEGKVVETTEKSLEEKHDVAGEKTNIDETKDSKDETSVTNAKTTAALKDPESKVEKEIPPEETPKDSSQKVAEISKPEPVNNKDETKAESIETPSEQKIDENTSVDIKENDKVTEEQKPKESAPEDLQVNGDATNGKKESVSQNGDSSKDEELSSRLSVENGKEVNGSNGDSMDAENGTDKKVEADVTDIKIKTVATEEPHKELIDQPTEA